MKRIANLLLVASVALFAAAPALAAKPVPAEATISIDNQTPAWGDLVTFTADANVTATYIFLVCETTQPVAYSYSVIDYTAEPYQDSVGLDSPAWPDHTAATCTATVRWLQFHGNHHRETVISEPLVFPVTE